ncbi:transmembrane protein 45B-like [Ischnura elegans]|uniref:transmembrane protein 45B-like n=1 Tax=Ischnura elegans TaxID=197161 RepID=UPI001ED8939A|nr:transmembrane protein 45B-like [Ischnura elegans]XP_046384361.1 transmembrane protein 45B-like [Ischnura elegans]
MGTFLGHVVPGTFFIGFALWWIYSIFRRYFIANKFHHNGIEGYRNTISYPCHVNSRSVNIEGYLKVICTTIGIIGETATAFEDGHWAHLGNGQHITMFAFFGISGVVDLIAMKKDKVLPANSGYAVGFLAFAAEGFLFYNHLHGRTHMDVQVHMMLFCAIVGCAVSAVFEAYLKNSVIAALSRAYFTLLQGTWFYQVGFILYPPFSFLGKWNEDSHEQMMIVTMIYTWHAAFHIALIICAGFWVKFRVDKLTDADEEYSFWAEDSAPLYKKLSNMDNQWIGQYKDSIEDEPSVSRRNEKFKSEIIDSDLEAP